MTIVFLIAHFYLRALVYDYPKAHKNTDVALAEFALEESGNQYRVILQGYQLYSMTKHFYNNGSGHLD